MSFNVLTAPWIPMADGEELPLLDALARADELEGVRCASPLETCAVYRLMIAFVMDALSLENREERMALLKRGRFDMDVIRAYVKKCEGEGASFDLFDPVRPFMQAAPNPTLDSKKKIKSAANMALQLPSGINHLFFHHNPKVCFAPDEALRQMLATYLFCTVGGKGFRASLNDKPCYYVLHGGENLFQILVFNMISKDETGNIEYGLPAWSSKKAVVLEERNRVRMLEGLTWMPRRIIMKQDQDETVSQIYFEPGPWLSHDDTLWRDPHVPYRIANQKKCALVPKNGRGFWRDLDTMTIEEGNQKSIPPFVFSNSLDPSQWHRLIVTGITTDQASKFEIISENGLKIPSCILTNADSTEELRYALNMIEAGGKRLEKAARQAFQPTRQKKKGKEDKEKTIVYTIKETFFKMAEEYIRNEYLNALSESDTEQKMISLREKVRRQTMRMMLATLEKERVHFGNDGKRIILQAKMRKQIISGYPFRMEE